MIEYWVWFATTCNVEYKVVNNELCINLLFFISVPKDALWSVHSVPKYLSID